MKLSDIQDEIEKDSKFDDAALDRESLRIPVLHSKYYRIFIEELRALKIYDAELKAVRKDRYEYYMGRAPDEAYQENPLPQRIIKQEVEMYLDSDDQLQRIRLKVEMQKAKVEMVEGFIKTLASRNFLIKNAIEWRRFQHGG